MSPTHNNGMVFTQRRIEIIIKQLNTELDKVWLLRKRELKSVAIWWRESRLMVWLLCKRELKWGRIRRNGWLSSGMAFYAKENWNCRPDVPLPSIVRSGFYAKENWNKMKRHESSIKTRYVFYAKRNWNLCPSQQALLPTAVWLSNRRELKYLCVLVRLSSH